MVLIVLRIEYYFICPCDGSYARAVCTCKLFSCATILDHERRIVPKRDTTKMWSTPKDVTWTGEKTTENFGRYRATGKKNCWKRDECVRARFSATCPGAAYVQTQAKHRHATDFNIVYYIRSPSFHHASLDHERFPYHAGCSSFQCLARYY